MEDNKNTIIDDEYVRAINEAYWEEINEFKLGIHPTQLNSDLRV